MNRFLSTLVFFLSLVALVYPDTQTISLGNGGENTIAIANNSPTGFRLHVTVEQLRVSTLQTRWGGFTGVALPQFEGGTLEIGKANLPEIHKLIDVPYGAEVEIKVLSSEYQTIDLTEYGFGEPVFPYQGPIAKTPGAIKSHRFRMDQDYYRQQRFQELPIFEYREVGNLRSHILGQICLNVVQYHPAANQLRIYTNLELQVEFKHPNLVLTRNLHRKYDSPYFSSLLKSNLVNFQPESRDDLTHYPINYLIIYYDSFAADLQPFIDWKIQKGFTVTTKPISIIGNTTTAITNYIQSQYNGPNPPSFVVLVGDYDQITSYTGQTGSHKSDLYYTTMTAGDFIPDIYIGRLSAQVSQQLTPQIDKILHHEKYRFAQTVFLNHGSFAATSDAGNYQIAEGTHNYVINTHFIPNNLLYDKLYAITYGSTGQDVMNAVNDGRFILNYSGHGSTTSWAGPNVTQSMVNNSTNAGEYPFVISNACLTGSFQVPECFGETWVRKANGGGLAFTGASNSTYWDEDDEWERRAYDGVFWENYHSLSAFIFRGNLGVLNAGYNRAQYYFEVYHLFGDPSTMLYWGEPAAMTVNSAPVIYIGSPVYDVTVVGEDSALVSLTMNGQNYGTALTDASGYAQVQLNPVPTTPGYMSLTITKFNRKPYVDSLQVIPATGPYLYCLQPLIDDQATNNNGIPEAGETVNMSLQLANMGIQTASNIQATLSTTDTLAHILNASSAMGSINAGDTVIAGNFQVRFAREIPHLHICSFNLQLTADGGYVWDQTLVLQIRQGGQIEIVNPALNFPNTFLNYSTTITVPISNTGADTLWVNDIVSSIPQFSVNPAGFAIAPGAQQNVDVIFTPEAAHTYNAVFSVSNSDPVHFDTSFTASGTGVYAPLIAVTPDTVNQQLLVNDSVTVPITLMNQGLGELTFNAQIAGLPQQRGIEGSGGTDNFGHLWIDSDEPGGPQFDWIDISQTGSQIQLTGNNSVSDKINFPFDFPFYGDNYHRVRVCTNGWMSFTTYSVAYQNYALPSLSAPRALIAPLWDDLNFTTNSKLFYQQESNKLIFQFQDVYRISGEGPYNFEVILYQNGNILLQYLSLTNLMDDYTVGIQNQAADDGLTVAFNEPYLHDSLAVLISKFSWATISPMSGTVPPQSNMTLQLTMQTHNFPTGEFWASIQFETNDPANPIYYVPIHVLVDSVLLDLTAVNTGVPAKFKLAQNWPNPFNPTTTINYYIPEIARVELAIYNVLGQKVKTLVNRLQQPKTYRIEWDGTNDQGHAVASGIYIYRLQAGKNIATKKLILMR